MAAWRVRAARTASEKSTPERGWILFCWAAGTLGMTGSMSDRRPKRFSSRSSSPNITVGLMIVAHGRISTSCHITLSSPFLSLVFGWLSMCWVRWAGWYGKEWSIVENKNIIMYPISLIYHSFVIPHACIRFVINGSYIVSSVKIYSMCIKDALHILLSNGLGTSPLGGWIFANTCCWYIGIVNCFIIVVDLLLLLLPYHVPLSLCQGWYMYISVNSLGELSNEGGGLHIDIIKCEIACLPEPKLNIEHIINKS